MSPLQELRTQIETKLLREIGAPITPEMLSYTCTMLMLLRHDPEGIELRTNCRTEAFAEADAYLLWLNKTFADELAELGLACNATIQAIIYEAGRRGITERALHEAYSRRVDQEWLGREL